MVIDLLDWTGKTLFSYFTTKHLDKAFNKELGTLIEETIHDTIKDRTLKKFELEDHYFWDILLDEEVKNSYIRGEGSQLFISKFSELNKYTKKESKRICKIFFDKIEKKISTQQSLALSILLTRTETLGIIKKDTTKTLKEIKTLAERMHISDSNVIPLPKREKYIDAVIKSIETGPNRLRAIIIGPHFLHPEWLIQRRLKRESRKSFRLTLSNYLKESVTKDYRDIRLIIRNTTRYPDILKKDVGPDEIHDLTLEMKSNLHALFSAPNSNSNMRFICLDPGFYHADVITNDSLFVPDRDNEESKIESGYQLKDSTIIEYEINGFDRVFDTNFKSLDDEIIKLENYIMSLEESIYGIEGIE